MEVVGVCNDFQIYLLVHKAESRNARLPVLKSPHRVEEMSDPPWRRHGTLPLPLHTLRQNAPYSR